MSYIKKIYLSLVLNYLINILIYGLKNKIIPYNTQYTDKEDIDAIVDLFNSERFLTCGPKVLEFEKYVNTLVQNMALLYQMEQQLYILLV